MTPARRNQNWLPSIFGDFLGPEWLEHRNSSAPAVNIIDTESGYKVEVAAPGMTRDDFKVHLDADNELVISLEKKSEQKEEDKERKSKGTYLRREFSLHAVPAAVVAARQHRARQDLGEGRARRHGHRHPQEEGGRGAGHRAPDRGEVAAVESGFREFGREARRPAGNPPGRFFSWMLRSSHPFRAACEGGRSARPWAAVEGCR